MSEAGDRRQGVRVAYSVDLKFNVLEKEEDFIRTATPATSLFQKTGHVADLSEENPVEALLLQIDAKLNYVIDLLTEKVARKEYRHRGRIQNLSAEGLRFNTDQPLREGTVLEIGLVLPNEPHRTMDIAARVLEPPRRLPGVQSGDHPYDVSLAFADILLEDQDTIVHFIFQTQREEIRSAKT
jgi:c-di-GMP-binding flagellar brake protein YcgR